MKRVIFSNSIVSLTLMAAVALSGVDLFAQKRDSTLFFRSALSVTHNGFSFIPSFSLGKPAAILEMAIGNKRLSFEPQFRFALEGKPWSFIFIYRYKFVDRKKFQFTVGGHLPAFVFVTRSATIDGITKDVSVSQRFLAGELLPTYFLTNKVSVGAYVLKGHGFQDDAVQNSTFVGFRANLNNVKLTERFFLRFNPQIYYLSLDGEYGYYATYTLTLAMTKFPLSITHIANKAIQTEIQAKDFDWNVSLVYTIDKSYIRQ